MQTYGSSALIFLKNNIAIKICEIWMHCWPQVSELFSGSQCDILSLLRGWRWAVLRRMQAVWEKSQALQPLQAPLNIESSATFLVLYASPSTSSISFSTLSSPDTAMLIITHSLLLFFTSTISSLLILITQLLQILKQFCLFCFWQPILLYVGIIDC